MSEYLAIGLVGLGFVLLFLELFLPSGILGISSAVIMIIGVVLAFIQSTLFGTILVIIIVVGVPLIIWRLLKTLPKTRLGKAIFLEGPKGHEDVATQPELELKKLAGKKGVAISQLRPVGVAEIDGKRYQVMSEGMLIDEGTQIEVIDVTGNRVVVRPVRDDETKFFNKESVSA
jgi:membrane-bound serine protease (ClpP class)